MWRRLSALVRIVRNSALTATISTRPIPPRRLTADDGGRDRLQHHPVAAEARLTRSDLCREEKPG